MSVVKRTTVVCPIIDTISSKNFGFVAASKDLMGIFDYNLVFRWQKIPKREMIRRKYDESEPIRTPTMAGGLFTIDRSYFYELGTYDEGMEIWGSENLEISFRVWMCGGTLLIVPCSHVGHVFRKKTPYTYPNGHSNTIAHNTRRLIDVWTDDYMNYFQKTVRNGNLPESGDISSRLKLKKDLGCKNFKWYIENIYPEAPIPVNSIFVGAIESLTNKKCLDYSFEATPNSTLTFYGCHHKGNQLFDYKHSGQLKKLLNEKELCITTSASKNVQLMSCSADSNYQKWDWDVRTVQFNISFLL